MELFRTQMAQQKAARRAAGGGAEEPVTADSAVKNELDPATLAPEGTGG
jgi:hypothetical protein